MATPAPWIKYAAAVSGLLIAGAAGYWYLNRVPEPAGMLSQPSLPPATRAPEVPAIRYPVAPIVSADEETAAPVLPAIEESDPLALESLLTLYSAPAVAALLRPEFIIPRIVATVDNLPRDKLNAHAMPVKPVPGIFIVDVNGDEIYIGTGNAARYDPYVEAFVAADTAAVVAAYRRNYPLFQQAYRQLGDPDAYFNDRLIDVIDHMLLARNAEPPIALVKPRSTWDYADPELQSQSIGHRLLIRMGEHHAERVKAKLGEIRAALIASPPAGQ